MEQRVVLSVTGITDEPVSETADTAEAGDTDSVWIDIGYPVQTDGENAIDDQGGASTATLDADLNTGSVTRSLAESAATEAGATDAALEEVYDSSFVDTAAGTAADDLLGTNLDDYEFQTGKIAETDYNYERSDADLGGDGASSSDASTEASDGAGDQLADDAPDDADVTEHGQFDKDSTIEND